MNNIRSILDREALAMYSGDKAWNKAGIKYLESEAKDPGKCGVEELWRAELYVELAQLGAVQQAIEQIEIKLNEAPKNDRGTCVLMSIPGS